MAKGETQTVNKDALTRFTQASIELTKTLRNTLNDLIIVEQEMPKSTTKIAVSKLLTDAFNSLNTFQDEFVMYKQREDRTDL